MIPGLQASGIFVDPKNSQNIILLTQAHDHEYGENYIQEIFSYEQFGPMKSADGGKTWTKLAANLPVPFRNPFDGDVAVANFNHLMVRPFLFGEEFPPDVQQKSFYSIDGGKIFKETSTYINIGRYDPHDQEGNHLVGYAPWYADGDIVESRDAGATWKPLGQAAEIDNTKVKVTNFVWDPNDFQVIYMSGTQGYVWKSADGGKTWKTILNLEEIEEQTENQQEIKPVLKNLGIKIEPWDKTTNRAGDFLFENKNYVDHKIFTEFAHKIVNDMGEKLLPEIGFNVPVGTKVVSPIDGVITDVKWYEPSQDYIISMKTDESSPWMVGFEHVYNVRLKVGDNIFVGQEIAQVSPSYGRTEFGNVEIDVWIGGQSIIKYCPFEFLDETLKPLYDEKINQLAKDWEEFIGEDVYRQEEWVAPGCLLHNITER